MGLHVFFARLGQFHGDELVTLRFETLDDFSDKTALDSVRLDL